MEKSELTPVTTGDRIESLDLLRGIAVMGILIMNIQSYSMIFSAYINPSAYGDLTGINLIVWSFSHFIADSKFMGLFSILFGAGVVLFSERIVARGGKSGFLHYRRTFWLLVFGLMHAYLLWHGDILVTYALCALIIYLYRRLKPRTLLILAIISLFVGFIFPLISGMSTPYWPEEQIDGTMETWSPDSESVEKELETYRTSFTESLKHRKHGSVFMQTFLFVYQMGWRAGGLMLLGMAFYKWGILSAKKSKKFYINMLLIGLVTGTPLITWGMLKNFEAGWKMEYSMFFGPLYNYWGSILICLVYISIINLWSMNNIGTKTKAAVAAVGKMAFSNYILQTLICTLIFYNYGLGLFGYLERWQQILIVPAVWVINFIFSSLWLKKFRFGQLEWVWRSLTYWKVQPLRKEV